MATSSSIPQTGLLSLPDELLLEIVEHLKGHIFREHDSRRTGNSLYGITLTNRRLYNLSKSLLYSVYSFHYGSPDLFLRTICENQHLASQVNTINWDYATEAVEEFKYRRGILAVKQQFNFEESTYDRLNEKVQQGNVTAERLIQELRLGRCYLGDLRALNAIFIFTPNLERLEVVETYRWDDHSYWFRPILDPEPHAFSRLHSVKVHGPLRLENVVALLTLSSMRNLELRQVIEMRREEGRTFDWEHSPSFKDLLEQRGSNIESFHLLQSFVNFDDLRPVMRAFRALKSFVYEHDENELSVQRHVINYKALAEILSHHRHTLTFLRIVSVPVSSSTILMPYGDPDLLFRTVQDFPDLTSLELPLFSSKPEFEPPAWDMLPPNLTHLVVVDSNSQIFYTGRMSFEPLEVGLEVLAARKRQGELPSLQSVTLKKWHPWYGSVPHNISYFKALLEGVGMQLHSVPAEIGSSVFTMEDIACIELQTEPGWIMVEEFNLRQEYEY
ncbi:hypothetical protein N0V90_007862 [Kalmusia sp. IMI 367209]|nr:hypothetical protein N0V90_007862 [Kalmusia sp. IMI 367209]